MVLYTGAGHQRIIIFSLFCLQLCLPLLVHFPRRAARSRPARGASRVSFVIYTVTDSVIQPRGSRRATHICSLLYLAPSGDGRYVAVGNLGSLPSLARRCRASREPGCKAL